MISDDVVPAICSRKRNVIFGMFKSESFEISKTKICVHAIDESLLIFFFNKEKHIAIGFFVVILLLIYTESVILVFYF